MKNFLTYMLIILTVIIIVIVLGVLKEKDDKEQEQILSTTTLKTIQINDSLLHVSIIDCTGYTIAEKMFNTNFVDVDSQITAFRNSIIAPYYVKVKHIDSTRYSFTITDINNYIYSVEYAEIDSNRIDTIISYFKHNRFGSIDKAMYYIPQ